MHPYFHCQTKIKFVVKHAFCNTTLSLSYQRCDNIIVLVTFVTASGSLNIWFWTVVRRFRVQILNGYCKIQRNIEVIILRYTTLSHNGLFEVTNTSSFLTMWRNPRVINSELCQLHLDLSTFVISIDPVYFVLAWKKSFLSEICCSKKASVC